MFLPPPNGVWGMPDAELAQVEGYEPDTAARRAKAQALMAKHGYGASNPIKVTVSTRNIPAYRDPAVLLIDHLRHVFIEGELEPLDTPAWYARMVKKDYQVGMNAQGMGNDDPDTVLFENFACGSERNYTNYCDAGVTALLHKQSQIADFATRRKLVWEIDRKLQEDGARPVVIHTMASTCRWPHVKGVKLAVNSIYNNWRFEDVWLDR